MIGSPGASAPWAEAPSVAAPVARLTTEIRRRPRGRGWVAPGPHREDAHPRLGAERWDARR